jgi:hypothetical protein
MIADAIEVEINDGCGVEGEHLAEKQTSGNGNAQRPA